MKVIDGVRYMQVSDFGGVMTGYYLRKALKKLGRVLFGAFFKGGVLFLGALSAAKVYMAVYF